MIGDTVRRKPRVRGYQRAIRWPKTGLIIRRRAFFCGVPGSAAATMRDEIDKAGGLGWYANAAGWLNSTRWGEIDDAGRSGA